MGDNRPERPPRRFGGQRYQPLRSAGLLVEVVRTLTTSPSQAQKELVKEKLEKDYAATKQVVDHLVDVQHEDVAAALQSFRLVSTDVQTARERIKMIKNNLSSCQLLLRCKRDELKKLWLESAELKYVVRLLEQLESVKFSHSQIVKYMEEKHFLHAAETLGGSCALLDGRLRDIDGLKGLRNTFEQLKEKLYCTIIEEITKQLYAKPCSEAISDVRRANVLPKANGDSEPLAEATWNAGGALIPSYAPGGAEYAALMDEVPAIADNRCALEDLHDEELTSKPVQYIAVLVDSLGLLGLLDRASCHLVDTVGDQLWSVVVYRTSRFICDHLHGSTGISGEARSLAELLRLLFVQFRFITAIFGVILGQFERVLELRHQKLDSRFNVQMMWDQVQLTIERLLSMYLNVKPEPGTGRKLAPDNESRPISTYFVKKGPLPPRTRLFGFDGTAFAQAYHSERKPSADVSMTSVERGEVACICRPGAQNIKAAFRLVMRFVSEIEAKMSNPPCHLRLYVNSYIKKSFLPNLREDVVQKAQTFLLDRNDTWSRTTSSISVEEQAAVLTLRLDLPDSSVPLFISTVKALDCCHDVVMILSSTPSFCREFFQLWMQITAMYLQSATTEYGSLSCSLSSDGSLELLGSPRAGAKGQQLKAGEGRKISSAWATDGDISRLLKSLPNWQSLAASAGTPATTPMSALVNSDGSGGTSQNGSTLLSSSSSPPKIESAEEVRSRNSRESEILMGNLGSQAKIETSELLLFDARRFRLLAHFQESVEYFSRCSRSILASLPAQVRSKLRLSVSSVDPEDDQLPAQNDQLPLKPLVNGMASASPLDEFLTCLANIEQLASTCLLTLHLEARVHCFYHLLPLIRQPMFFGSSQEVDDQVIHLNKDLIRLNEILSGALQAPKHRYIFEGLGHLISTIFISGCQYIVRISDTGKKRICRDIFSIQQCLSDLTGSREPDLDQARRFYELLYKSPDDILNAIVEGGAEFAVTDYTNLLALSIRSHPVLSSEPGALEQRLGRLKAMLTSDKRHLQA